MWCSMSSARPLVRCQCPDANRRRTAREIVTRCGLPHSSDVVGMRRLVMGWPGRAQRPKATVEQDWEASKLKELTMHTHQRSANPIATIGLDIGKNTFHLVGLKNSARSPCASRYREPAYPPTCQSAALPYWLGGRVWLASHSPRDPPARA